MNCALPWASPELFADAALELEYLDSLLVVLPEPRATSSALTCALSQPIGQRTGDRLPHLSKSNFDGT